MTRWQSLSERIAALEAQIRIEKAARRGVAGLEAMLRDARHARMRIGNKVMKKQGKAA